MSPATVEVLAQNPNIDRSVVNAFNNLQAGLPDSEKRKEGADYRLAPALGGQTLVALNLVR